MSKIKVNGIRLYYEIHGQGFPFLLIRGLGSNADHWYEQVPAFSAHYQVIVFDNRGIGRSDAGEGDFTISTMAADIKGLMDGLGLRKAHILGVSLGGLVAQEMALAYPQRVQGLVLGVTACGGPHVVRRPEARYNVAPEKMFTGSQADARQALSALFAEKTLKDNFEKVERYLATSRRYPPTPEVLMQQRKAAETYDAFDDLPRITAHTLVLAGSDDARLPPENSRILSQRIPNAKLHIIEGGGHMVMLEQPRLANQIILDFLKAVDENESQSTAD